MQRLSATLGLLVAVCWLLAYTFLREGLELSACLHYTAVGDVAGGLHVCRVQQCATVRGDQACLCSACCLACECGTAVQAAVVLALNCLPRHQRLPHTLLLRTGAGGRLLLPQAHTCCRPKTPLTKPWIVALRPTCRADGRSWTSPPGKKMDNGNQQFPDKKVISVVRTGGVYSFQLFFSWNVLSWNVLESLCAAVP